MSQIVVQKYGGTSVGDLERIQKVAARIARYVQEGDKVAVTVSAMGRTTDRLIGLAKEVSPRPSKRELDVLMATGEQQSIALVALALQQLGVRARSFTGQQAGFLTDSLNGSASIIEVNPAGMLRAFEDHQVIVIAGFQGVDAEGNITTLGRGGSDTTAVAAAAALGARECEIYTDTEGIYTTDPHLIPEATKLDRIDYDEMLELASLGAKVLHPRSVWYGRRYGVTIHVRSSFSYNPGTIVTRLAATEHAMKTDRPVTGVALDRNHVRINLLGVPDVPGVAAKVFTALGNAGVSVDMIIQGVPGNDSSRQQMAFTVNRDTVDDALEAVAPVLAEIGGRAEADPTIAKVSIVGIAIGSTPGIAGRMFAAIASVGANIEMIATSEVRISAVIPADKAEEAVRAVHQAFELDKPAAPLG
ncbi:MAG: aspartate kinase [Truepera sp.]|nr:aspartate kinase [Truepera sp.]MBS3967512.1 aspartate kinase [Truepera sp.]